MKTLIVIDGENLFNSVVRAKLAIMKNIQPIVVVNKKQKLSEDTYEKMEVIEANAGCKNAVDFVVVSVLTHRLVTNKYSNAIILSDDHGYRAAVQYLNSIGHNVTRVGYKDFISGGSRKQSSFDKMIVACCGYINNHLESGIRKEEFNSNLIEYFGKNSNDVYSYLIKSNLISCEKNRIHFKKERLASVAKAKYNI